MQKKISKLFVLLLISIKLVWILVHTSSSKSLPYKEYREIHLNPVVIQAVRCWNVGDEHVLYTNTAKALVIAFGYSHSPRARL